MAIKRMDHVGVAVHDLKAAIAFFEELGMEHVGGSPVSGDWVDSVNGLKDVRLEMAMLRTPDGHSQLELMQFENPPAGTAEPSAPPNTIGYRSVMFAVDDIHDTVARLKPHGGELMGEITPFESIFLLCYLRGPSGLIVALAEELGANN
ncbi:VOC family protein [Kribbella sp. NPDC054772]